LNQQQSIPQNTFYASIAISHSAIQASTYQKHKLMTNLMSGTLAIICLAICSLTNYQPQKLAVINYNNTLTQQTKQTRGGNLASVNSTVIFSQNFSAPHAVQSIITNSTAMVVSMNGEHWLKLGSEGAFTFKNLIADTFVKMGVVKNKNLPAHFSFEIDVMATGDFTYKTKELATVFAAGADAKNEFRKWGENRYQSSGIKLGVHPIEFSDKNKGQTRMMKYANSKEIQKVEKNQRQFTVQQNRATLIFERNEEQLTVHINGEKAWDVFDAFDSKLKYNSIIFTTGAFEKDNQFYITNIRLLVNKPEVAN
jgi:hypothetical protein